MKKNLLLILTIALISSSRAQQQLPFKSRLFINIGAGPSYSLFYAAGGWVRDFGQPNFTNKTVNRNAWAFSHFAELEWRFRNPRWSWRAGYSMHHFFPEFAASGFSANNTRYDIDTHEADRYIYIQSTIQFAIIQGINRLEFGTGLYIQFNRRQEIEFYEPGSFYFTEYEGREGGFPFNLDYTHFLHRGTGIGCRLNFNYSASVDIAEHLALQCYVKARL